jgi:hypothetical protein
VRPQRVRGIDAYRAADSHITAYRDHPIHIEPRARGFAYAISNCDDSTYRSPNRHSDNSPNHPTLQLTNHPTTQPPN